MELKLKKSFATDEQSSKCRYRLTACISSTILHSNFLPTNLFETEEGQDIGLSYLKERGFREDIIQKFQLGYSPEQRDAFTKAAIASTIQYRVVIKNRTGCKPQ